MYMYEAIIQLVYMHIKKVNFDIVRASYGR